jgi:aminoacyl tRNA synthase complex-interacting multifunctional protein 1
MRRKEAGGGGRARERVRNARSAEKVALPPPIARRLGLCPAAAQQPHLRLPGCKWARGSSAAKARVERAGKAAEDEVEGGERGRESADSGQVGEMTTSVRADIYTREQLIEAFDLNRVTASPAQFDQAKLKWINGQHLRAMSKEAFMPVMEAALLADGVIGKASAALTEHVAGMVQEKCDLVNDASAILSSCLDYELAETAKTCEDAAEILGDDFAALASAIIDSVGEGAFPSDMTADSFEKDFKSWINGVGKATGRKGKRLFMPVRLALTGNLAGPDIGLQLKTVGLAASAQPRTLVTLEERMKMLRNFVDENPELLKASAASAASAAGGAGIPDDRVAQKIIETVAKLSVAQQREVLAVAEQQLAAAGGSAAVAAGKKKGGGAMEGKVLDRSGNVEPVTRLDIRVGQIVSCERHPDADALYVEQIDVGEAEPRTVISGLANFIPLEEMQGRKVAVVCNLKPAKMRGIMSSGMVLCGSNEDHSAVEILDPPADAQPGEHLMLDGFGIMKPDEADAVLKSKSQQGVWKMVAPDLRLVGGEATYNGKLFTTSAGPLTCKSLKDGTVG